MLSNVISTGKEIASKLTNKILNLSEVEAKIKDATNDDSWGPSSSAMREIAEETFSTTNFHDVMTFLWYRIFSEKPVNGRRVHKGLILLAHLIVNGSELVAVSCKAHLQHISKLRAFTDPTGNADMLVRNKAADICELLGDAERLSNERKRAINYRARSTYSDAEPNGGTRGQWDSCKSVRTQSLGDIEDWEPSSRSLPYMIGESFMNFVNTFTQNISGPPPTETHDNFELPSSMDGDYGGGGGGVHASSTHDHRSPSKPRDQFVKPDPVEVKPIEKIEIKLKEKEAVSTTEILDAPIIDFSEPAVPLDINNNKNSSSCIISSRANTAARTMDIMDDEDEFGNLHCWNEDIGTLMKGAAGANAALSCSSITPAPVATYSWSRGPALADNDFSADFDALSLRPSRQPMVSERSAAVAKSPTKVSGTWSEIDKLNIDLNNLCSGRKRAFSKS